MRYSLCPAQRCALDSLHTIPILRSMAKYRDSRRGKRGKEARVAAVAKSPEARKGDRFYSPGNHAKNSLRMLDALGVPMRRQMVARLQGGGAMSLSKLAEPLRIKLPTALEHIRILERSNIVSTHKQGRVRICVYNPSAFKELAAALSAHAAFWESSFDRLERHISKNKSKKK